MKRQHLPKEVQFKEREVVAVMREIAAAGVSPEARGAERRRLRVKLFQRTAETDFRLHPQIRAALTAYVMEHHPRHGRRTRLAT